MNLSGKYLYRTGYWALLVLSCVCVSAAQIPPRNEDRCTLAPKDRARFKMAFERKGTLPPYITNSYIVVKPENYNREFMRRLVLSLNYRYCSENFVSGVIFDDKTRAEEADVAEYLLGKTIEPALRGFYWLDREKGRSGVTFSNERGASADDERIDVVLDRR